MSSELCYAENSLKEEDRKNVELKKKEEGLCYAELNEIWVIHISEDRKKL